MNSVFCNCDRCGKEILVGQKMYSLTLSQEHIVSEHVVQPLQTNSVQSWCDACGPKAVSEIASKSKVISQ